MSICNNYADFADDREFSSRSESSIYSCGSGSINSNGESYEAPALMDQGEVRITGHGPRNGDSRMKFAKFTLSLLAVALFAAAPSSAFAGRGLLDGGCGCAAQKSCGCAAQKSCGCATQKGGHVIQKGPVVQKGHIAQKGLVHQKAEIVQKGGACQKGCGSSKGGSCGSCSICLPRVLPALIHGIDTVLNKVFCCNTCGAPKGCGCATQKGHVHQKGHIAQKGSSCGCGDSHQGPSNPFIDDLQPPPVLELESDARVVPRREVARPVSGTVERPTRSVIKTASATSGEPRTLPAELVSPAELLREVRVAKPASSVIRTSATTTSGMSVPSNPLR